MENLFKEGIWKQFGGSIEMLENAIKFCPAENWDTKNKFWYNAFHCLFFMDYYLTLDHENFMPPKPFTLTEFEPIETMPERVYTKEELLVYLNFIKNKCHELIKGLTTETLSQRWVNPYRNYSIMELLIYNLKHVQHHVGQLNLILRHEVNSVPKWVSHTKTEL